MAALPLQEIKEDHVLKSPNHPAPDSAPSHVPIPISASVVSPWGGSSPGTPSPILPPFEEIPRKWKARVDTQCGKCDKEFLDMIVALEKNLKTVSCDGEWTCTCGTINGMNFDTKMSRELWEVASKEQGHLQLEHQKSGMKTKKKANQLAFCCCFVTTCSCWQLISREVGLKD
eukprot:TRINITY_DN6621_c1_g1_i1.p1 TRINITY_DN6621_c1_g1~~TRINITY_DN6621_c1_g1_i1.p1  ORF type:complete len:173 (+),score=20.28 TRINITY_DN6621_c1_g1_i1:41-559(+)